MSEIGPWEKLKIIGKGGSSTVFKCYLKNSGSYVAVKEIQTDGLTKDQILAIGGEVETMKNLNHENIVRYIATQQNANYFYIILEYADRGSLRQFYQKFGPLQEFQAAFCTKQILEGLYYLHENGIAHRDIKGANVLMTNTAVMKLADFGASKRFDTESIVSGLKGTPHWMAPEVIKGTQMTTGWLKADVWSIGCTVVEMLTGKIPYYMYENPMTAMYHIASGESPPLIGIEVSEVVKSFVRTCCSADPNLRPPISALLLHPFVHKPSPPTSNNDSNNNNSGNSIQVESSTEKSTDLSKLKNSNVNNDDYNNNTFGSAIEFEKARLSLLHMLDQYDKENNDTEKSTLSKPDLNVNRSETLRVETSPQERLQAADSQEIDYDMQEDSVDEDAMTTCRAGQHSGVFSVGKVGNVREGEGVAEAGGSTTWVDAGNDAFLLRFRYTHSSATRPLFQRPRSLQCSSSLTTRHTHHRLLYLFQGLCN